MLYGDLPQELIDAGAGEFVLEMVPGGRTARTPGYGVSPQLSCTDCKSDCQSVHVISIGVLAAER